MSNKKKSFKKITLKLVVLPARATANGADLSHKFSEFIHPLPTHTRNYAVLLAGAKRLRHKRKGADTQALSFIPFPFGVRRSPAMLVAKRCNWESVWDEKNNW